MTDHQYLTDLETAAAEATEAMHTASNMYINYPGNDAATIAMLWRSYWVAVTAYKRAQTALTAANEAIR